MNDRTTLLWLRRDLRLADHPALSFAVARGRVVPVFILDANETPAPGAASRWALHYALKDLSTRLEKLGAPLVLRKGDPTVVLRKLIRETGADCLAFTRAYGAYARSREAAFSEKLGIDVRIFGGSLLFEPEDVRTRTGASYKVFTPFYKACLALREIEKPLPAPRKIAGLRFIQSDRLESWKLLPSKPDWSRGLAAFWRMGEAASRQRLFSFIEEKLVSYAADRDRPDKDGTSLLSAALHFGQISPRQVFYETQRAAAVRPELAKGAEVFIKELCWREFSYHLLFHFPDLLEKPLQKRFARFSWRNDEAALRAWQRGQTGYPIVDAGMRQLWQTGYMHNRVRMIVASFLVKDLLLPWQAGEAWFWDTLCDADPANNAASWQWVAGCGADAAPYFRVFNPVLQGKKFDPEGVYIKRYVPELKRFKGKSVHEPWREGGQGAGKYPKPLVDHALARRRALAAYKKSEKT